MGGLIAQLVMGLVGSGVNAAVTYSLINREIREYEQAKNDIKDATDAYSGANAYNAMLNKGKQTAEFMGRTADTTSAINTNPGGANVMSTATQAADPTAEAVMNGYSQGMGNAAAIMDAKYDKATKNAQTKMNQAGINFNVGQQATQGIVGGLTGLGKTVAEIAGSRKGE